MQIVFMSHSQGEDLLLGGLAIRLIDNTGRPSPGS